MVKSEMILTALHYLFSHDKNGKVNAHCLDLDLVASGVSIPAAEERLNAVVLAQIAFCFQGGNLGQLRFKAPAEYWQKLSKSRQLDKGQLEVEIPPIVLPVERGLVSLAVYRCEQELVQVAA
jgi:hypothetical protein